MEWFWKLFHWHKLSHTLEYKENKDIQINIFMWVRTWDLKEQPKYLELRLTELEKNGWERYIFKWISC